MTAVYAYQETISPPAPFAAVSVIHPENGRRVESVPAQIDTGAYKTVVPGALVRSLELVRLREVKAEGLHATVVTLAAYVVSLQIQGTSGFHAVEVLASDEES